MNRRRLPNKRRGESLEFTHAGHSFTLTTGFYPDGRLGEIFINARKLDGQLEALARDAAILVSIALQFGADIQTIRSALTKDHDGGPATLISAALDAIVAEDGR